MEESDAYVRDHLLIQFMQLYFIEDEFEVEYLYKEWINWLKKQEANNAGK